MSEQPIFRFNKVSIMTPAQLRSLSAVARRGSVRAAAEELGVTQPAVSSAVATLEKELGVELLTRTGRGVVLTAPGTVLAAYSDRLLGLWDEARRATVEAAEPGRGTLRLAAVTSVGEEVVPALLASFRRRHPGIEIVLDVGNRRRVWDLLAKRGADVAIGGRPPVGTGMDVVATAPNELVVVAAAPKRRTRPRRVEVADLAARTWLVREPDSGTRSTVEELFSELGMDPPRLTIGSNGAIREAVAAGLGLALLSRSAVRRQITEGTLEEWVTGPLPLQRAWNLVVRRDDRLLPAVVQFCEHLRRRGSGWTFA